MSIHVLLVVFELRDAILDIAYIVTLLFFLFLLLSQASRQHVLTIHILAPSLDGVQLYVSESWMLWRFLGLSVSNRRIFG